MPKNSQVICIGSIVRDLMFYTKSGKVFNDTKNYIDPQWLAFALSTKVNIEQMYSTWGGGAANTAVDLSLLGVRSGVVGCVGNDHNGREALRNMRNYKVDTSAIIKTDKKATGSSLILTQQSLKKEHIAFVYRGANDLINFSLSPAKLSGVKYFYLNALSGGNWQSEIKKVFASAKKSGIKIYWNPGSLQLLNGPARLKKYLAQTEALQINEEEAKKFLASTIKDQAKLNDVDFLLNKISELGPKIVIITLGEKGAGVICQQKIYRQKVYLTKNVDTLGVGDSFGSAFLASLIYEPKDLSRALAWGLINSGCNVSQVGAQKGVIGLAEIKKIYHKLNK